MNTVSSYSRNTSATWPRVTSAKPGSLWDKEKKQKSEDEPIRSHLIRSIGRVAGLRASCEGSDPKMVLYCARVAQRKKLNLYGNVPKLQLLPFRFGLTRCRRRINRTLLEELERRETFTLSLRNACCLNGDEKTAQSSDGPVRSTYQKPESPHKVYEYITIPTAVLDVISDVQTLMYIDVSLLFHVPRENGIRRHKGKLRRI